MCTNQQQCYLSLNSASWNGKVFGLGEPAANEIIDGGLFAKMAAAKVMSNKANVT